MVASIKTVKIGCCIYFPACLTITKLKFRVKYSGYVPIYRCINMWIQI